jgi:hypothetical protein
MARPLVGPDYESGSGGYGSVIEIVAIPPQPILRCLPIADLRRNLPLQESAR